MSKVTLEQWRMLHAVVEYGGFAQASSVLHKSQSTISYAVTKLQDQLGVRILEVRGRKAELTEAGKVMLRRSQVLLKESDALEKVAGSLAMGWEGELTLAVEVLFPYNILMSILEDFSQVSRNTRLELVESVLSGTTERVVSGQADLVITGVLPTGFLGEKLLSIRFVPVARFDHPLLQLGRTITEKELKQQRQIVVRDSGMKRSSSAGWLGTEERWTVSNMTTVVRLLEQGLGFAWLPEHYVDTRLKEGSLQVLPLDLKGLRDVPLYLVFPDADNCGPATQALANLIRNQCRQFEEGLNERS
ncbi:LysR family transcriptional regulator [Endozoicomonas montiporae]|uniref:LysR family transcriptional regulator n=2 Tax=Endozoicomonas montiporae TaxID=1027273 RepID=A0A081N9R1_9GAMM|nr:LysR family transcriptional regulator [Endozoicomonas montiporae]AMO55038.1 transcriptional regulator [Endozoicomonas montiporae CL-33]KEQ15184.1 LysR family transcriptional regulator [Endozoicomonas montiporae]